MATLSPEQRKEQIWSVIRVSSGNFLEMYDFFVFGYYASAIGKVFFPTGSDFAQLMLAFMTFGAGFLMRPLGGIFLGAYIDHYGRRAGFDADARFNGSWHSFDRAGAGLCHPRRPCASDCRDRPINPRILCWCRAWWCISLPRRNRYSRQQGFLCQL